VSAPVRHNLAHPIKKNKREKEAPTLIRDTAARLTQHAANLDGPVDHSYDSTVPLTRADDD